MSDQLNFDQLLHKYIEGLASEQEVRQLEQLLLSDDTLLERASEQSLLHRQVFELLTEQRLHEMMDEFVGGAKAVPNAMRNVMVADQNTSRTQKSRQVWQFAAVAALLAASLLAVAFWNRSQQSPSRQVAQQSVDSPSADAAATLTQLFQATWKSGAEQYQFGEALLDGSRIALQSGMAKVTFECGAEVMLEGPCDFVVRDEMVGVLREGKIAANVPRRAFSFAILLW